MGTTKAGFRQQNEVERTGKLGIQSKFGSEKFGGTLVDFENENKCCLSFKYFQQDV
jgi:hypothetical protein